MLPVHGFRWSITIAQSDLSAMLWILVLSEHVYYVIFCVLAAAAY